MESVSYFALPKHTIRQKLRPWFFLVTLSLFGIAVLLPPPDGLSQEGMRALAIFGLAVVFWVTNAIPLMITSMLAIVLLPLLGVLPSGEAYALFGNQAVFFILGAFILASSLMRSGVSTRLALWILQRVNQSPRRVLLTILLLPAALSFVMSEHAVVAMLFPIVTELLVAMKLPTESRYGKATYLALSWGAIIGGIATFLGGARAVLAVGILEQTTGQSIGFLQWLLASLPVVVVMLVVASILLLVIAGREEVNTAQATDELRSHVKRLGPISRREIALSLLMLVTVIAWVTVGHDVGLANIALLAVAVAFVGKLMSWKEVQSDVNWGVILMYGGAIALGSALVRSGAAQWVATMAIQEWEASIFLLILVFTVISKFLTEGMSNTAVVALMMPIGLAVASQYGVNPQLMTLAITIPTGLAFMLPMGTPATAIAVSSPHVTASDTMKYGLILNVLSVVVFGVVVLYYWPLIGFTV